MVCCNLNVEDDVFGAPLEEPVNKDTVKRGQWRGLTMAVRTGGSSTVPLFSYVTTPQTYDIVGVPVLVSVPVMRNNDYFVTATVNNGPSVTLPWRPTNPGFTNLLAARFRAPAEFLVIRDVWSIANDPNKPNPTKDQYSFTVFDLRPGTACGRFVKLVIEEVDRAQQLQFCPSKNGELSLIWHGVPTQVVGCRAWIMRTTIDGRAGENSVVTVRDDKSEGRLACEIRRRDREVTIFDKATISIDPNNVAVVSRSANSAPILPETALPRPGKLKLSARSITIGANQNSVPLEIENSGGDYLELVSITIPSASPLSATPTVPLPRCLAPGEKASVTLRRSGSLSSTTSVTLTVETIPQLAPSENTVTVRIAVSAPQPAISVSARKLVWKDGDVKPQEVKVKNAGNITLEVEVAEPATGSLFQWNAVPKTSLAPDMSLTITGIMPRSADKVEKSGNLRVIALLIGTSSSLDQSVELIANPRPAKVLPGDLKIMTLLANPIGDDILPEGEFIEIANMTDRALDLSGCTIQHMEFRLNRAQSQLADLVTFPSNAFGADSLLESFTISQRVLRVLTRAKSPSDPPSDRFRFYCDRRAPIWNNDGDTAVILNELKQEIDTISFVSKYPPAGRSLPPGTIVVLPPRRTRIAARHVFMPAKTDVFESVKDDFASFTVPSQTTFGNALFTVQEGDVINIAASGNAHFGGFLGRAGSVGPGGFINDPAPYDIDPYTGKSYWPLPGAPKYALIGMLVDSRGANGIPFLIGSQSSVTVSFDNGPYGLYLGTNDEIRWDNSGYFDIVAVHYR